MPKVSPFIESDPAQSSRRGRLEGLTGLRFYAALLVFIFHAGLSRFFAGDAPWVDPLQSATKNFGWAGVTFFFILSGFVLTWSARSSDPPSSFIWRRIAKIAPNHIVTFVIALGIGGLAGSSTIEAAANLTLLHAWIPRDTAFFSINHPSWSLSAEMFFYCLFPLALSAVRRVPQRRLVLLAVGLVSAIMVTPLAAELLPAGEAFGVNHAQSPLYGASIVQTWAVYALPATRFLEFLVGVIAARLVMERLIPTVPLRIAGAMVVVGLALSLALPLQWQLDAAYVLPVVVLVIGVAQSKRPPALIASPIAVRLGELSFAFYVVHDICLSLMRSVVATTLPTAAAGAVVVASFGLSLVAAWALWRYVEVPANIYLRSRKSFTLRKASNVD